MATDGKQFEFLIQLIEKTITPRAIVEHDVDMPVLSSRIGATTQCDIVIRSGIKPRQTITIVEVQDRSSRVKPNDFRGWKQKLEDVGAQHLLCISRQEFPASIKEQAALSGGSIMLVTLKDSNPESIPLDFVSLQYQYDYFDLTLVNKVKVTLPDGDEISLEVKNAIASASGNANDFCWSEDGLHPVSLYGLCRKYHVCPDGFSTGTGEMSFSLNDGSPLYFLVAGIFQRIGLDCEFECVHESVKMPISVLTYEQDQFGAMAWVAEVVHDSLKGKIVLRMPIVEREGRYLVRTIYAELPGGAEVTLGRTGE